MPKGKGKRKAQPPVPPSSEQQAQAEGLTLLVSKKNTTGYFGVCLDKRGHSKPYKAEYTRGSKKVYLGSFATAAPPAPPPRRRRCASRERRRGRRRQSGLWRRCR